MGEKLQKQLCGQSLRCKQLWQGRRLEREGPRLWNPVRLRHWDFFVDFKQRSVIIRPPFEKGCQLYRNGMNDAVGLLTYFCKQVGQRDYIITISERIPSDSDSPRDLVLVTAEKESVQLSSFLTQTIIMLNYLFQKIVFLQVLIFFHRIYRHSLHLKQRRTYHTKEPGPFLSQACEETSLALERPSG